ncbi:MAG: ABC transporter ATP-binding protein [Bosea sp.]|uniref:ABC transporter ATP-binding protein n=1 Tax=unclassified Bosea (in: a-proteobacteria) TaxID=2653178 RepID=UPI000963E580|nr:MULTISPECIES: ABC transporter ATP-binding protein [unclassified Bosea (in: a-proteobacteria)]MBN9456532.1 ABC transporter ATP-binding protein [Bosea sp. (in: a-proteobacteria)]OJV09140.1 MAG: spermidine/putrescine ABC transporter ATP-binding protein [Bosea sp. 67-29]
MSYLELAGLQKRYGNAVAVDDVSLSVEQGESVALLGPSGCGKTTTLRMLAGLVAPDRGAISLDGGDITRLPPHRRNMGYVFQSYALFPHLTVARNIAFGLEERGVPRQEIARRVDEALALVRLAGLGQRRPKELSGGQQQRVALARALVIRPSVLLLDESLSNLDAKLRDAMRHEIRSIQRSLGITTLFVTHDQVEALTMCDRIAVMHRGRIAQIGNAEDIYDRPATRFVAEFVGRANVLPIQRDAHGRTSVWGQPLPLEAPEDGDLFVRPQRMRIAPVSEPAGESAARLTGRVLRSVFVGDHVEVLVEGGGGQLTVETPSGTAIPMEGAEVAVVWPRAESRVFAREAP